MSSLSSTSSSSLTAAPYAVTTPHYPPPAPSTSSVNLNLHGDLYKGKAGGTPSGNVSGNSKAKEERIRLNGALAALSLSPDRKQVVVGGREVLKILAISAKSGDSEQSAIREVANLRQGMKLSLNFSINDVKWAPGYAKDVIATAAANGAIVIWNVHRASSQSQRLQRILTEHTRSVNRIAFHPTESTLLLSASQDGSIKLWDLRTPGGARFTFEAKAESARDVQFNPSPANPFEFAASFENGIIQKWDTRNPTIYERKINAHNGLALCIDYSIDGRYLASGGRDKCIKVWDLKAPIAASGSSFALGTASGAAANPSQSSHSHQPATSRKPIAVIQTTAIVSRLQWRPNFEYQIVSCALNSDTRISVWDLNRTCIPLYVWDGGDGITTGLTWADSDTLLAVSKDRFFSKHNLRSSYRPMDMLSTSALDWAPSGKLCFASEEWRPEKIIDDMRSMAPMNSRKLKNRLSTPIEPQPLTINPYKLGQTLGTIQTSYFDHVSFIRLAKDYSFDASLGEWQLCQWNAEKAALAGKSRESQCWKCLQAMFAMNDGGPRNLTQIFHGPQDRRLSNNHFSHPEQSDPIFQSHILRDPYKTFLQPSPHAAASSLFSSSSDSSSSAEDQMFGLKTSASPTEMPNAINNNHGIRKKDNDSSTHEDPPKDFLTDLWSPKKILLDIFEHYITQGDVQICVFVYYSLENLVKGLIDEDRLEMWVGSYIQLLHRSQLYSQSNALVLRCNIPSIREQNQESTTVYTSCNNCLRPISNEGFSMAWYCEKCKKTTSGCSICRLPVKGEFSWCQCCGHGGHTTCLNDWFKSNSECSAGCGHSCVPTV